MLHSDSLDLVGGAGMLHVAVWLLLITSCGVPKQSTVVCLTVSAARARAINSNSQNCEKALASIAVETLRLAITPELMKGLGAKGESGGRSTTGASLKTYSVSHPLER